MVLLEALSFAIMIDEELERYVEHVVSGMVGESTNAFLLLFGALQDQPTFDRQRFIARVRELTNQPQRSEFQKSILNAAIGNLPDDHLN